MGISKSVYRIFKAFTPISETGSAGSPSYMLRAVIKREIKVSRVRGGNTVRSKSSYRKLIKSTPIRKTISADSLHYILHTLL